MKFPVVTLLFILVTSCAAQRKATDVPTTSVAPGIYRVSDAKPLSEDELFADLDGARFVLVGEDHTSEEDHAVQLRVLKALADRGDVAVGMEMFQRPFQSPLDQYVAGELDEAAMLERTEWEKRWGFGIELYQPFWLLAKEKGFPIVALNARRELTKRIAKVGVAGLTPEERADLPELDLSNDRYRTWMRDVFASHGAEMDPARFERFFEAQVTWDETMADTAVRFVEQHPETTLVVIVGRGHVERDFGIPSRIRRRTNARVASIIPVEGEVPTFEWMRREKFADYVWVR